MNLSSSAIVRSVQTHLKIVMVSVLTCIAVYAIEALVTRVMPCIHAFLDRVALESFSTELGEVNMCLKA